MDEFKHLFPRDTASTEKYIYAGPRGGGEFELPPRDDRVGHGSKLVTEINSAVKSAEDEQARKYCRLHIACRLLLDLVESEEPRDSPLWIECKAELEELLNVKGLENVD